MMLLALCGVLEAVVYQFRYRSAVVGRPSAAAGSAFLLAVLRVLWTVLGVSAWMGGQRVWVVCAAYAVPVALATWAARWFDSRRHRRMVNSYGWNFDTRPMWYPRRVTLNQFVTDQERADAEKHSASRIGPTNTEVRP